MYVLICRNILDYLGEMLSESKYEADRFYLIRSCYLGPVGIAPKKVYHSTYPRLIHGILFGYHREV